MNGSRKGVFFNINCYSKRHDFIYLIVHVVDKNINLFHQDVQTLPEHVVSLSDFIGVRVLCGFCFHLCWYCSCLYPDRSFTHNYLRLAILVSCLSIPEGVKGVIRSRQSKKDRQYNGKWNGTKGYTMVDNTIHRKLYVEHYAPH